jgi:hypothetical protein
MTWVSGSTERQRDRALAPPRSPPARPPPCGTSVAGSVGSGHVLARSRLLESRSLESLDCSNRLLDSSSRFLARGIPADPLTSAAARALNCVARMKSSAASVGSSPPASSRTGRGPSLSRTTPLAGGIDVQRHAGEKAAAWLLTDPCL